MRNREVAFLATPTPVIGQSLVRVSKHRLFPDRAFVSAAFAAWSSMGLRCLHTSSLGRSFLGVGVAYPPSGVADCDRALALGVL